MHTTTMPRLRTMIPWGLYAALLPAMPAYGIEATTPSFSSRLPIVDTLDVFLQAVPVGSMIGSTTKRGGFIENVISLSVEVSDQHGFGRQHLSLEEVRRYDTTGALCEARQKMHSAAGITTWRLDIDTSGTWLISVTTAGVTTSRPVKPVPEKITTMASLYEGLFLNTLQCGTSWTDTSIELTSGESIISETRCVEMPSERNGDCWVFDCSNSLLQRRELWKVDRQGATVYRDMYPYAGRKKGTAHRGAASDTGAAVSLFEMMKVKKSRAVRPGRERIAISFDNNQPVDQSVAAFFRKRGTKFILNQLPDRCRQTPDTLPVELQHACLAATPTLQTTHPKIRLLADSLHGESISVCELIGRYNRYVYTALQKRSSPTFSSALETLEAGYGDCGEHAVLLAALLRASGIPARVVMGIIYSVEGEGYFYHAWVMAYAGQWIFADPSHDCFPAYKDRIPLIIDDDGTKMMGLAKIIGRIQLHYVDK
ncbi:MAG: transglutaminase domain-containing protein [Chitinispirillaceae bacterium]|nr:transglutaminase domain-containing protein [Chitinispirillaceae bacterium]